MTPGLISGDHRCPTFEERPNQSDLRCAGAQRVITLFIVSFAVAYTERYL